MEPTEANGYHSRLYKLHSIEENECESETEALKPPETAHWTERTTQTVPLDQIIPENMKESPSVQPIKNSKSIVSSAKKVISALGPSGQSLIADFVHINDCLKSSSEKCSEQTETVISDLCIHLVMVRNGVPDPHLQVELRNRLRLLENDNKEVVSVFSELSARLLSIESDKGVITVTFKTFEEIWKFSTYYTLGFLTHCLENMFLDQSFWLSSPEEEDAGLQVCVKEETVNLIYRNLLMEEGMMFVLCADNLIRQAAVVDNALHVIHPDAPNDGLTVGWSHNENSTEESKTDEPLCPFHQWFLKTNSLSKLSDSVCLEQKNKIAVGWTEATVSYESAAPDEIAYCSGDIIEIIGTFVECLKWFVGRNMTTDRVGFVKTSDVKPYASEERKEHLAFPVSEENRMFGTRESDFTLENAKALLHKISHSDVCNVYRVDELEAIREPQSQEITSPDINDEEDNWKEKMEAFLQNNKECCPSSEEANEPERGTADSSIEKNVLTCEDSDFPSFCISEELERNEGFQTLLLFLNSEKYLPGFRCIYDISYGFLHALFHGYKEEEELVRYLSMVRDSAKKASMPLALTRICFLLGRLCTKRLKFSQARVYFEEATGVLNGDFRDIYLTSAIYMNLTAIYLKQKNNEKCSQVIDKATSLLIGLQSHISSTEMESLILKYALKTSILNQDLFSETRSCLLLGQMYTSRRQFDEALPFIEHLQVLSNKMDSCDWFLPGYYFQLADIYSHKCLPHIALSSIKVASRGPCSFTDSLRKVDFIIGNAAKLCGIKGGRLSFPTQISYYLRQALDSAVTDQEQILSTSIYRSLWQLCTQHKEYKKAKLYILKALDPGICTDMKSRVDITISLAWLYMLDGKHTVALDILDTVKKLCHCSPVQLGIIYNLSAIAFKQRNRTKEAAEHYFQALQLSKETAILQNQAAALANFGTLFLHLRANNLAENFLVKSVAIYSRLPNLDNGDDFIHILLILGHYYIKGDHKEKGRLYYEWAFLVAMEINHLESQLQAVQSLCHFYSTVEINEAQCIIYNEYQLSLARKMSDKDLEGQVLETISHLYLSLGTERACRSALEYTKRSLGIFIDLQKKEKEAYAWLLSGKIYYILGQNELVDLYIQVAQNVALCTAEAELGMQLFEAAGDIFFNGTYDRDKAVSFYRDCALPLAVKTVNIKAELRLCNKLAELLMNINSYEDVLEPAKRALELSVSLGNQLNERVSYHRLAGIYRHLGQSELAEHFYLKALSLCPSPMELEEEAVYYMKVYYILGDIIFYDLKDPFDAAGYYNLALAAAMDLGNKKSQLKIYVRLATIYHNFLVDREKSLFFYQKAQTFASELNVRRMTFSSGQNHQAPARTSIKLTM
ncbi:SH3 domain and tetratricopeptide repeat-containing protein 1 isoform X1 [Xenopus laevis]|uniref:SH3 domain and tetratricopeptide repeat-containing protein 1 isoform X1 n=1 Tax=Xenopus laevis TaxID=8355 RepID=A0A8J1MPH6_XENLA|nr:SH3 domain and tetratricopeptide repeat-containing protein 1 isoform X1 [Xenopus laevis]